MLYTLSNHNDITLIEEIIIVDNGKEMSEREKKMIEKRTSPSSIEIVENESKGYASGVNEGASKASEDILIIANNDIEWQSGETIRPLIKLISQQSNAGAVGPQLVNQDGSWQRSSGNFPSIISAIQTLLFIDSFKRRLEAYRYQLKNQHQRHVDYVDGAFLVTSKKLFNKLGGWDEEFSFYAEDADYCFRAKKAGRSVILEPESQVVHIGGATSSTQALNRYSEQLAESTTQFVKANKGTAQSKLYAIIMILANFERYILYLFLNQFRKSDGMLRNRQRALARCKGYVQQLNTVFQ